MLKTFQPCRRHHTFKSYAFANYVMLSVMNATNAAKNRFNAASKASCVTA